MKQVPFKEREIIDMGAGYKLATLGQGSTVRIHCPDGSYLIVTPHMYYEPYEQMARALAAEHQQLKQALEDIKKECSWVAHEGYGVVSTIQEICEEGLKMSDNLNFLHHSFEEFSELVYPGSTLEQKQEMRLCFMAGAESLRGLMLQAGEHGIESVAFMDNHVREELSTFHENTMTLFEFEGTPQ